MKKIKVLQMPVANARGGVTHYVLQNWKYIDRSKFQFDFMTMEKYLDFADDLEAEGCKIHYISARSYENREVFVKQICRALDEGYDAIHLHTSQWTGFLIEEIAIKKNCPKIIVHAHNAGVVNEDISGKYKEMIVEHYKLRDEFNESLATHFLACSTKAADWLFGEQIPRDRIHIMKNAIEVEQFDFRSEVRNTLRRELGLEGCTVFGHVGRFAYQKNHEFLLKLFARISGDIKNARLLLVGVGPRLEEMQQLACSLNVEDKILFLGKRNDVNQLMQAMDAFLLPSRFEGLGIVLVEAQAAGVPCCVSDQVPTEVDLTGNISFLPLDIDAWHDKIISDYKNPKPRRGFASEVADAGYSIQKQILELEKVYSGEMVC